MITRFFEGCSRDFVSLLGAKAEAVRIDGSRRPAFVQTGSVVVSGWEMAFGRVDHALAAFSVGWTLSRRERIFALRCCPSASSEPTLALRASRREVHRRATRAAGLRRDSGRAGRDPGATIAWPADSLGWFTDQAYNLILLAEDEARMMSHATVEPEHLLLAAARRGNVERLLVGDAFAARAIHDEILRIKGFGEKLQLRPGGRRSARRCCAERWPLRWTGAWPHRARGQ